MASTLSDCLMTSYSQSAELRRMLTAVTAQASAATAKESHRVLRSALTAACREELISRNVAKLVPAPRVQSRELKPWDPDQTTAFLEAARKDNPGIGIPREEERPALNGGRDVSALDRR